VLLLCSALLCSALRFPLLRFEADGAIQIVTILIGAIWGLWIGFGITAAGTLLGEVGSLSFPG
jgi:uncharacterized membrane protein YdjX (TVP38/TMEM64 family)